MKLFGYIIAGCLLLALMRLVLAVLAIAFVTALLCGLLFRPKEFFGLLLLSWIANLPSGLLALAAALLALVLICARVKRLR